jgi:hypothetical protein
VEPQGVQPALRVVPDVGFERGADRPGDYDSEMPHRGQAGDGARANAVINLYVAVYHSRRHREPEQPGETARALFAAAATGEFPYDSGDDPSFYSARHHGGPVTWGVCRTTVRASIQFGDWVAFFSVEQEKAAGTSVYRFVGTLQVERKIAHTSLFDAGPYSRYLNLLIRRHGRGWEHFEPGLHPAHWHKDWLWRICRRGGLDPYKEDLREAGKRHRPGQPIPYAAENNYVVFSPSASIIADRPPVVAIHRKGDPAETWESHARARAIRSAVFGDGARGLRTTNVQRAHPHARRRLDDRSWLLVFKSIDQF